MDETADANQASRARWGLQRRLEFIELRLCWEGSLNRRQLCEFFGISAQQASADLAQYGELAPGNLTYDRAGKTYRPTAAFQPALTDPSAQKYLNDLTAVTTGQVPPTATPIGWRPPADVVHFPTRKISTAVLLQVLWAIRDKAELEITYQSMRRPAPSKRWIAPHAIAFDGLRWHARAWCTESAEFRDFVLSRIQVVHASRATAVRPQDDVWWNTTVNIEIRPREELTAAQRRAVEADYGMQNGRLRVLQRKALAFYFLRQLQLDRPDPSPVVQPLKVANPQELADVLAAAQKTPAAFHIHHTEKSHE